MIEGRDIIYFVSNGSVNIVQPTIISKLGHKPNSTIVATRFLGSPVTEKVATATIVLSIVFGILLLILLVLGLIKLGFFNRKKKEELEALKSETNVSSCKKRSVISYIHRCVADLLCCRKNIGSRRKQIRQGKLLTKNRFTNRKIFLYTFFYFLHIM